MDHKKLEGRWWHRLAKVLFWVSTAIIAIGAGVTLYQDSKEWTERSIAIFSFEPGYADYDGKEVICVGDITTGSGGHDPFTCGGIQASNLSPIEKFNSAVREKFNLPEEDCDQYDRQIAGKRLDCIRRAYNLKPIEEAASLTEDEQMELKLMRLSIKAKIREYLNMQKAGNDIFKAMFVVFGWVLFWAAFVYRAILYIAFGKEEKVGGDFSDLN